MMNELKYAVRFALMTMVLFSGAYPLVVWSIGAIVFPRQAVGSLIARGDDSVVGSRLIAQAFTQARYFHPRPSGVDYNAAATGGTNYSPSNGDHLKAVQDRLAVVMAENHVASNAVPSEMVTASGAGLDPHIPPAAAELQADRVAAARGVPVEQVRAVLRAHVESPTVGALGRPRVNVLELNLALDQALGGVR